MLIDSHCHLDLLDLAPFDNKLENVIARANDAGVIGFLNVAVNFNQFATLMQITEQFNNVWTTIGLHPNEEIDEEPNIATISALAGHPRILAVGETGLDYFRTEGDREWQRERFRVHIQAARHAGKPLIIHTRDAREDTIAIMKEEGASEVGGVMHCFAEDWKMAKAAMDLNFYISFSGIVSFKNAKELDKVAKKVPDDLFLIETDSPYLAPEPHRGKPNEPAFVKHVAEHLAALRKESFDVIAEQSTQNFIDLFQPPH